MLESRQRRALDGSAASVRRLRRAGEYADRVRRGRRRRLLVEPLEERRLLAGLPYGATSLDTAEFLLGKVVVTPVFLESREGAAYDLYDWGTPHIQQVKQELQTGVNWWSDTLASITDKHELDFIYDFTYADQPVSVNAEPIENKSIDYSNWVTNFLETIGSTETGDLERGVRLFNESQRQKFGADWSFTIFVANAEHDLDGSFATCGPTESGCFSRAFAFAGGLFIVTPSTRPASSFAHETGHIFWAFDEYVGGESYVNRRGYYDTQNLNAADNPTPGFQQQPSIMTAGSASTSPLVIAYNNHTSAASTLALVGWRDSDGDGVFDLLDVPHTLSGVGYVDPQSGQYRFIGQSSVQTLPNRNSSGLQNDITINKISRAEYRIDGGAWQTAATYGGYTADIDVSIPVPAGQHQIELRTIDGVSGVTSPIFVGTTNQPAAVTRPGVNGFVWNDADADGQWDPNESGMSGWTVRLVDAQGQPISLKSGVEPDVYGNQLGTNATVNNVNPLVTLSAVGSGTNRTDVKTGAVAHGSTGDKAFYNFSTSSSGFVSTWTASRQLRMDFASAVSRVQLDAVADSDGDFGRLEAYDSAGNLIARYTTGLLQRNTHETMTVERSQRDISYVLAFGHMKTGIVLDNLRFGAESTATTGPFGAYSLPLLPAGSYRVQVVNPGGWSVTSAAGATRNETVASQTAVTGANFGLNQSTANWQNPNNRLDVNNDTHVSPIDALLIINVLNEVGSYQLAGSPTPPTPYIDVNGDGFLSPIDALLVINELNRPAGSGEGTGDAVAAASSPDASSSWTATEFGSASSFTTSSTNGATPISAPSLIGAVVSAPTTSLVPEGASLVPEGERPAGFPESDRASFRLVARDEADAPRDARRFARESGRPTDARSNRFHHRQTLDRAPLGGELRRKEIGSEFAAAADAFFASVGDSHELRKRCSRTDEDVAPLLAKGMTG